MSGNWWSGLGGRGEACPGRQCLAEAEFRGTLRFAPATPRHPDHQLPDMSRIDLSLGTEHGFGPDRVDNWSEGALMTVKVADSKGRLALGGRYANATMIVEESEDGAVITLKRAVTIPVNETWLFRNPKALDLVLRGLEEARAGKLSATPPDLDADEAWVDDLED